MASRVAGDRLGLKTAKEQHRTVVRALLFLLVLLVALMASELRSEPGERHEMTVIDTGEVDRASTAAPDGSIERPYRLPVLRSNPR